MSCVIHNNNNNNNNNNNVALHDEDIGHNALAISAAVVPQSSVSSVSFFHRLTCILTYGGNKQDTAINYALLVLNLVAAVICICIRL